MREGGSCATLFRTARKSLILNGEMAEWLKAHAWKACVGETLPRVRIPLSPPVFRPLSFLFVGFRLWSSTDIGKRESDSLSLLARSEPDLVCTTTRDPSICRDISRSG